MIGFIKIFFCLKEICGLEVFDEIGKCFLINGDVFGFSYNGDKMVNFVGIEIKNMIFVYLFGLCIIFVMDFCKVNGGSF